MSSSTRSAVKSWLCRLNIAGCPSKRGLPAQAIAHPARSPVFVRGPCDAQGMTHARVLASHLADLLSREHAAMADFLVELADFDRLKSWEELGYSSLFHFLHREL